MVDSIKLAMWDFSMSEQKKFRDDATHFGDLEIRDWGWA